MCFNNYTLNLNNRLILLVTDTILKNIPNI